MHTRLEKQRDAVDVDEADSRHQSDRGQRQVVLMRQEMGKWPRLREYGVSPAAFAAFTSACQTGEVRESAARECHTVLSMPCIAAAARRGPAFLRQRSAADGILRRQRSRQSCPRRRRHQDWHMSVMRSVGSVPAKRHLDLLVRAIFQL